MQADAVIVAAGGATRFGSDKMLADLSGQPVIAWSLAALARSSSIGRILIVCGKAATATMQDLGARWANTHFEGCVVGGQRRRDSVEAGLRALPHTRYVAIHDGARPLLTADLVDRCVQAAIGHPGAICAVPVTDTIKEVENGQIFGHPERSRLWAAQTPQVVLRQAWLDAAGSGDDDESDDAAMLARLGLECRVVDGSFENFKITRPLDLDLARLVVTARMTST